MGGNMIGMTYDEIAVAITEKAGLKRDEIDRKVDDKLMQLSGLISREGAAHIIANELRIRLFEDFAKKIKINRLVPGMGNVGFSGKVVKLYGVREFKTDKREGKVATLLLGDDSGTIRLVLWDTNHIAEVESGKVTEGGVIRIENAYVKENNGWPEVHLSNRGKIITGITDDIGEVRSGSSKQTKKIAELKEGDYLEIMGTIVQVFEPKFYNSCPECKRRINFENGIYTCAVHGNVQKKDSRILSFYLDDGSSNIRVVAFGDVADIFLKSENFEQIKEDISGMQVRVNGKAIMNNYSGGVEFRANSISELDAKAVSREIIKQVEI